MKNNLFGYRIKRHGIYDAISKILVFTGAVLMTLPIIWLIASSFKHQMEIYQLPPVLFSRRPTLDNLRQLFVDSKALQWLTNSTLVSLFTTIGTIITGTMAAYAFSKLNFYGRKTLFIIFVSSIMIPNEVMIVPLFNLILKLKLQNTITGMALPAIASAIGFFMMKGFIDSISDSMRESAKIDGASEFMIFYRIILPMCKPGIGALFILTFVRSWNNYLWQLLMGTQKSSMTLMVGVSTLFSDIDPNMALKVAGAAIGAVPMLVVFFVFQKYFTRGISMGAVKG